MSTHAVDAERARGVLRPALIAAAGLVAVVVAIGLNFLAPENRDSSVSAPPADAPATSPSAPVGGEADVSEGEVASAALPSFDVVRINPRGDTVIAGRAVPGAGVVLRDGDHVLGEVSADGRGEWVFVPDTPLPPGSHRLGLAMRVGQDDPVVSADEVIIVVPKPGEDVAGRSVAGGTQPLVLRQPRGGGPAVVMQSPGSKPQDAVLAVDTIDAGGQSSLTLTGRAPVDAQLRVNVDGQPVGDVVADAEGQWKLRTSRRLDGDRHGVSVDLLDAQGRVVARSSVPLQLGETGVAAVPGEGLIIVQRGENLWRIARSTYGTGPSYTIIYEANRGRITNPDLIYPGQVFRLPPEATDGTGN